MAKATKVTAVEIVVGGKTIRLYIDEAQELHKSLDELFSNAISYIPTYRQPYWEWNYPDHVLFGTNMESSISCRLDGTVTL